MHDWYRPMKYAVVHLWAVFVHLSIEEGYDAVIFSCHIKCLKTWLLVDNVKIYHALHDS